MLKPQEWSQDEVTVGWVGHSTVLMQLYDTCILTDPVLGKCVGEPIPFLNRQVGMKRHMEPAAALSDLKQVQLILLSHAHFDHFDIPSLSQLAHEGCYVVTSKHTARLIKHLPFKKVYELEWDEEIVIEELGISILGVPVKHWGNRYPWNCRYGYNGYLIGKRGTRIFFPGDTAYTKQFQKLSESGPVDLAFMPIGAYSPDHLQRFHCTPEQAWAMFRDMGAKWLVPVHWNTFVLSSEPVDEPLKRLIQAAGNESGRIVCRNHGDTFIVQSEPEKKDQQVIRL